MTSQNLEKVIQRAISDAAFRRQLQSNPEAALRGFKLTADELTALRSGDAGRLQSLGIDQRMSKVFVFGEAGLASASLTGSDLSKSSVVIDDAAGGRGAVIPPGPAGTDAVLDEGMVTPSSGAIVGDPIRAGGSVAPVEGSPEASAAEINASATTRSAVRDVEPAAELGSSATYSGDDTAGPGYQAANDQATIGTRISGDVADPGPGYLGTSGDVTIGTRISGDVADPGPGNLAANDQATIGTRATREGMSDSTSATAYGENYPAHGGLAGPSQAGGRAVRDVEPSGGSGVVTSDSSEPTIGTRAIREGDAAGTAAAEPTIGTRAAREGGTGGDTTAVPTEYTSAAEMSPDSAESYAPSFSSIAGSETTAARAVRDSEPSDAFLSSAEANEYAGSAATSMTPDGAVLDAGAPEETDEIVRDSTETETNEGARLDT